MGTKQPTQEPKIKFDRDGFLRCRVCGCTEREPCNPPCAWSHGTFDVCDNCAYAVYTLDTWLQAAHRPSMAALLRELRLAVERRVRPKKTRSR